MPRITFSTQNARTSEAKFPLVKLDLNDTWRVVFAESEATYEWAHVFRKPKLSPVSGKLMEREIKYNNGDTKMVPDLDFVGAPLCVGNLDVLEDRGVDPDHCPGCEAAMEYPDWFQSPERKFAVHVLKYATRAGSAQVVTPLGLETRVWKLNEKRYGLVSERIEEFGGDPMSVDLILGPCTSKNFQNYEISGSPNCVVASSDANRQRARETFEGNNAGDLAPYCGRKTDVRFMKSDIEEVVARWRAAQSGGVQLPPPDFAGTLAESGAALLDPKPPTPPSVDLSALDDTVGTPSEAAAPASATALATPAQRGPSVDFGSLMAGLDLDGAK